MGFFNAFHIGLLLLLEVRTTASIISSGIPGELALSQDRHQASLEDFAFIPGGKPITGLVQSQGQRSLASGDETKWRLPKFARPINYNLVLLTNLKEPYDFHGDLRITVEVTSPTKEFVLHQLGLKITKARLNSNLLSVTHDEVYQLVILKFFTIIPRGTYNLTLSYWGYLQTNMRGFYVSSTVAANGERRAAAFTQFESTDARRAFPCWDEPAFKATFDVTLIAPRDRTILSNMPVMFESIWANDPTLKAVIYERTPVMSTYLLAFVIGDFDFVQTHDANGVLIRIFTPIGKGDQGMFALQCANLTLPYYKKYFDIGYPLPKLDLVAVPDFQSGAMENWGLNTYRETALLVSKESPASLRQSVALVIAHELAHQWFGNLVTMEWWTHLWLNEGFASWVCYLPINQFYAEYKVWEQFVSRDLTAAFNLDARNSSHPIEVPASIINTPAEIRSIFDSITYRKGSSVIRMLENYLGSQQFKSGLTIYLNKHQYSNANTEDLWAALQTSSGTNVASIMRTWTQKMGFPLITVESEMITGTTRKITLRQEKFNADGSSDPTSTMWAIPIIIGTRSNPEAETPHLRLLLEKKSDTITIDNVPESSWLSLNSGGVGMYRVLYKKEMQDALITGIRDGSLPTRDRWLLISDIFTIASAGKTSMVDAFKISENMQNETAYIVWTALLENTGTAYGLMTERRGNVAELVALDRWTRTLFEKIVKRLGWTPVPGESHLDTLLRGSVISRLGSSGHQETIDQAKALFRAHVDDQVNSAIHPDLRSAVYSIVFKYGNSETLDQALELYKKAEATEERVRILGNLGRVPGEANMQKVHDFLLTDFVRPQDTSSGIGGCLSTAEGRDFTFKFLKDKWNVLYSRHNQALMNSFYSTITSGYASSTKRDEVKQFFEAHQDILLKSTYDLVMESITVNEQVLKRDGDSIANYLLSFQP